MKTKSIIHNSLYNVMYKGFTVIFPLFTSIYTSHVLLADGVGKVSYANTVAGYFSILAALGIPNYGIKAIAQNNDTIIDRSQIFWELFTINVISTSLCSFCYYFLVNASPYFYDRRTLFNISGLIILLNYFNVDWLFQGLEHYKYIAIRGTIIRIVSFIMVIIFVRDQNDYLVYALLLCVAIAGNYLVNFINIKKYVIIIHNNLNIQRHLKSISILVGSTIATEIYTMLDTIMIEYYYGERYVGLYTNVSRLVRVVYSICMALVATLYPRLSYLIKNGMRNEYNALLSRGLQIILVISVPCILGIVILSNDIIVVLFGNSFIEASITLRILSVLILIFSFAYLMGHIFLISLGAEKYILEATIIGALINMGLNMLLIPLYKHNGAAIASVLSEITVTFIMIKKAKKSFSIKLLKKDFLSETISLLFMGASVILLSMIIDSPMMRLIFIIPFAISVYFCMLFFTKHSIIKAFYTSMHR